MPVPLIIYDLVRRFEQNHESYRLPKYNETQARHDKMVARVKGLRGRMAESTRGVEGSFESVLSEAFNE